MAKKAETKLVEQCLAVVREMGGDAYHVHGSATQRKGEPDIAGWIPKNGGFVHFHIEAKLPGEEPDPIQQERLDDYAKGGYTVGVCHTVLEFIEIIRRGRVLKSWLIDSRI